MTQFTINENFWKSCIKFNIRGDCNNVVVVNRNRNVIIYFGGWNYELDLPHGEGKSFKPYGISKRDGGETLEGIYYPYGKISYKGHFKNGALDGFGHKFFPNGILFKGFYKNNKANGYGTLFKANKTVWKRGLWVNGELIQKE